MGDTNQEVMGEYKEIKYSPKPQDEGNPACGMMYQTMVEMAKAREVTVVAGGSIIDAAAATIHTSPLYTGRTYQVYTTPGTIGKYSKGNPVSDDVHVVFVTPQQLELNTK